METSYITDELTISAPDDAPGLASLHSWLLRSPDVVRHGTVRLVAGRGLESMGAVETIGVAVSSATAIANVLIAYKAWRDARTRPVAMTVTLNQLTVAIDDPTAREMLLAALSDQRHAS